MKNKNNSFKKLLLLVVICMGAGFMGLMAQNQLKLTSMCSDDPAATRRWRVTNNTTEPIAFSWNVYGTNQNGNGIAAPGFTFFETQTVAGPNTTRVFWIIDGQQFQTVKASGGQPCQTAPPVEPEPVPCGTNLLINGDFEAGNTGFSSDYTFVASPGPNGNSLVPENRYAVDFDASAYHTNAGFAGMGRSGKFMIVNGNTETVKLLWSQNVQLIGGKTYRFEGFIQNLFPASPAVIEMRISGNLFAVGTATGHMEWQAFSSEFTIPETGNYQITLTDINLTKVGNDFGLDDLSLVEVCPVTPQGCFAVEVMEFIQGKRNDGSEVSANRSNPANALFEPQNSDVAVPENQVNFVSLGFGGSITLRMSAPIANGPGNDFLVVETTYGNASGNCVIYPEKVKVYASQNNCDWIYLGEGCQDTEFDLGPLAWALYIKLVDSSPIDASYLNAVADGFDVDGIVCLNGFATDLTPIALNIGTAAHVIDFTPNNMALRKNGTPIINVTPNRRNPAQVLGTPQGTDVVNFFSLGFGGFVTVKFDHVLFDKDGADLQIVETSYGNPSCNNYPEKAILEGSLDGINWISFGEVCLDGMVDISAAGPWGIQYVRITDSSPISSNRFPGSADGYDVDGLIYLHTCQAPLVRAGDNVGTPDEIEGAEVYPNPFNDFVNLQFMPATGDNTVSVSIVNLLGAQVFSKQFAVADGIRFEEGLNLSELSQGTYIINIQTGSFKQTRKLVKR